MVLLKVLLQNKNNISSIALSACLAMFFSYDFGSLSLNLPRPSPYRLTELTQKSALPDKEDSLSAVAIVFLSYLLSPFLFDGLRKKEGMPTYKCHAPRLCARRFESKHLSYILVPRVFVAGQRERRPWVRGCLSYRVVRVGARRCLFEETCARMFLFDFGQELGDND